MLSAKNIFFYVLFLCFINTKAQDTLLLMGDSRSYGDSNVLRWNTTNMFSFMEIYNNQIVVQRKDKKADKFETISVQKGTKIEEWPINNNTTDKQLILAAFSISEIQKSLNNTQGNMFEDMQTSEDRNFYWSNLSLASDQKPIVANLLNLRFCDKDIEKNVQYVYRIYVENSTYLSDTLFFIMNGAIYEPEKPSSIIAEEKEEVVLLEFNTDKKYSGYFIEKLALGSNSFKQINKAVIAVPVVSNKIFYTDSVVNYQPNQYRIIAIDFFGDYSQYSDTLIAMGRDKTPPSMVNNLVVIENLDKTLSISWKKIEANEGALGIAIGVRYNTAEDFNPITSELLPTTTTNFNWKYTQNETDLYFVVQVFDTVGNSSYAYQFYQLNDETPPNKPVGLIGDVDSLGVVTLTWEMGKELDLDGYLIYFSNDSNDEFSGIYNTPLPGNIYFDTLSLKMLNKNVYYKIQAVDKRFNRSLNSDVLVVKRPDVLAPVSPMITDYQISDSGVLIKWIPSSSIDVVKHILIKKHIKSTDTFDLDFKNSNEVFFDKNLKEDNQYAYCILAIDDSQNQSEPSNLVSIKAPKNYYKPEVKIFSAVYDSLKNEVKLSWEYPSKNIKKIAFYKGNEREKVSLMPSRISSETNFYFDRNIQRKQVYFYAIKIYLNDGTETKLSVPVGVLSK